MTNVHFGGIFHPPTHHGTSLVVVAKFKLMSSLQKKRLVALTSEWLPSLQTS